MSIKKPLLSALMALSACLSSLVLRTDPAAAAEASPSIAVLPFHNTSKDPAMAWLGDGLSETLSTRLPTLAAVRVVERSQVERLIKEIYFSQSALSDEGLEVGKLMSAQYLVLGSYQVDATNIWFQARIVKVETGEVVGTAESKGPRDQVLQLQAQVAERLGLSLQQGQSPPPQLIRQAVLPPGELDFNHSRSLERVRGLLRELPRHDLDPLRQRNQAKYYQALEYLEAILTHQPEDIESLLYTAQIQLNLNQRDKALSYLQRAAELAPHSAEPAFALGIYHKTGRDFGRALPYLQQALARNPRHADAAYALAVSLHFLKREEEALDALFRALSSRPELQAAETLLKTILNSPRPQPTAEYLATKAAGSAPYAAAMLWHALEARQPEAAAPFVSRALAAYPELYRFYFFLGELAQHKNQPDLARQLLQRSMSLYPVYPPAHLALGDLYHTSQDCTQASRHYQFYLHLANRGERFGELRQRIQACPK